MQRSPYFSLDSTNVLSFYLHQPLCLFAEPYVVQNRIDPNAITGTRMLSGVAAAAAIVACGVEAYSPRRWLWLLCLYACVLYINASDDMDGYIARKYGLTSIWGKYSDGIADVGSWIILWCAMFYTFGLTQTWIPSVFWLLSIFAILVASRMSIKDTSKTGLAGFEFSTLLPLLVTTYFVFFPPVGCA